MHTFLVLPKMRLLFDDLVLLLLTIILNLRIVNTQCKDIPIRLGMDDLVNFGCKLVVGSVRLDFRNICEGERCPGLSQGSDGICTNGTCIGDDIYDIGQQQFPQARPVAAAATRRPISPVSDGTRPAKPAKRKRPAKGSGKLNVTIISGEFPDTDGVISGAADSYVVMCVYNGTMNETIRLPLTERNACNCRTAKLEDNNSPYWEHECASIDSNKSQHSNTILVFEAYDEEFIAADEYIAGNTILLNDIIRLGNNGKPFDIDLFGEYSAKITVNVTWTALK